MRKVLGLTRPAARTATCVLLTQPGRSCLAPTPRTDRTRTARCTGALKAPLKLSKDGCLYAETYIQRRVTQDNSSPTKVAQINAGISYYSGKTTLTPAQAFQQIFGVDLTSLTSFTSSSQVSHESAGCLESAREASIIEA